MLPTWQLEQLSTLIKLGNEGSLLLTYIIGFSDKKKQHMISKQITICLIFYSILLGKTLIGFVETSGKSSEMLPKAEELKYWEILRSNY